jgi:hypothetical protein
VVDVGSRLGGVLFVGSLFSNARQYVGVEMDTFFAQLSKSIADMFKYDDIAIVQDNVLNQAALLQSADVVILNNVL